MCWLSLLMVVFIFVCVSVLVWGGDGCDMLLSLLCMLIFSVVLFVFMVNLFEEGV